MYKCTKCGKGYPYYIFIEGKKIWLRNRKRCFECFPFNKKQEDRVNNQQDYIINPNKYTTCNICSRKYVYKRGAGHRLNTCNSCGANHRRFSLKKKAVEYKGGGCIKCGYNEYIEALCFHHKNPEEKDFHISGNMSRSFDIIKLELDKCDLLCLNCHAEVHAEINRQKKVK